LCRFLSFHRRADEETKPDSCRSSCRVLLCWAMRLRSRLARRLRMLKRSVTRLLPAMGYSLVPLPEAADCSDYSSRWFAHLFAFACSLQLSCWSRLNIRRTPTL